jgi:hypothetical protein
MEFYIIGTDYIANDSIMDKHSLLSRIFFGYIRRQLCELENNKIIIIIMFVTQFGPVGPQQI